MVSYPLSLDDFPKWKRVLEETVYSKPKDRNRWDLNWTCDVREAMMVANEFRYIADSQKDYWKTPKEFVRDGGGDCEDIAIWQMYYLLEKGCPESQMELVVGSLRNGILHAVLRVQPYPQNPEYTVILDNMLEHAVEDKIHMRYFSPIFALSMAGGRICR